MNKKKMWKRFFSLDRHHAEGFTLVELIVVIAILAILGGVAVPAYSGYVTRANKGADQTLIGEVQHALALFYYSNPDADLSTAWVKLNQEGTSAEAGPTGAAAMAAVFGENWQDAVGLKYADWSGESSTLSYKESSYYGHESELIGKVDGLTSALGNVIESNSGAGTGLIGGGFEEFLKTNHVDTSSGKAIGNAATLYVAKNMQGKEAEIKAAITAGLNQNYNYASDVAGNIYKELQKTGIGSAASMAIVYAYAEGFAQSSNQADKFTPDFSGVDAASSETAAAKALEALGTAFNNLAADADAVEKFNIYKAEQSDKDVQGFIDMMGTVHKNQDIISGNLNNPDCFTDGAVENMLKGHAAMGSMSVTNPDGTVSTGLTTGDGQVAVGLTVDDEGAVIPAVLPLNWNK